MDANVIKELQNGLSAAYINGSVAANLAYKPAFVSNNPEEGKKVISSVEDELLRCDQFQISVAFITMGGVTPLLQTLKELEKKGVKGQILTTNYLNFSEPRALEKLNGLKNITLKMYDVEAAGNGFHTKGYIFKKEEVYRIIIGSSNMTSAALTINKEWNTKLISTENGEVAEEIVEEFHNLWNSEYALPYDDFYEIYRERYNIIKHQREIAKSEEIPSLGKYRLKPNSMNKSFTTFSGTTASRALLFPMESVYESYVAKQMKKVMSPEGWEVSSQDKGHYLFMEPRRQFALRTDIVMKRGERTVILDTRWKSLVDNERVNYGISQADMYQMYAYSKKYNTPEIWLLYPMNDEMRNHSPIRFESGDGTTVNLHFVDVDKIEDSLQKLKDKLI